MKVCILAAGQGTRIKSFGGMLHKALLPLGNVPVISRIIAQFPDDAEIVVAVGHLESQIRGYLAVAHPDRAITFVTVVPYEGPGAGPGRSLWSCRDALREPFYLTACDTLIGDVPPLDRNFMGTQPVDDPRLWCTLETDETSLVRALHYKSDAGTALGFVGFAGIVDVDVFWKALAPRPGQTTEFQVDDGFAALVPSGVQAVPVAWIDTGTEANYQSALPAFGKNYTFYGKTTDVTYQIGDRIIKYFAQPGVSQARYERALANLAFTPVIEQRDGFYAYTFVAGEPLAKFVGHPIYDDVLPWLQQNFWAAVSDTERARFDDACRAFYLDKTLRRLSDYVAAYAPDVEHGPIVLNGIPCRTVAQALSDISETFWAAGLASTFHGDLHDENIIVKPAGGYVLIDWRQDFAGLSTVGDRYYDLAKFFHTLDLSVATMESAKYRVETIRPAELAIAHEAVGGQAESTAAFWSFVEQHGYDRDRINLLNGIIFINMAPLYDRGMAEYLYYLGRLRLEEALLHIARRPA